MQKNFKNRWDYGGFLKDVVKELKKKNLKPGEVHLFQRQRR
jgi:hypothetical protein